MSSINYCDYRDNRDNWMMIIDITVESYRTTLIARGVAYCRANKQVRIFITDGV